ncbi:aryl-alcohol oxidase [Roridomyces roridus]|uniref:Aryl-alcohol oxidase n=1 Tax=Roridomyces roridus TaxID=1738132 RepID=A0AAD7FT60_9AGAR|nr:aryl-alcohol oxidase [Roridomyces roridus]
MAFPAQFLLLLPLFLAGTQSEAKIYDTVAELPALKYDFIVVGGGTAGNAVANRLSENPAWSVLVIEGGPSNVGVLDNQVPGLAVDLFAPSSGFTWQFNTVAQPFADNRVMGYPRGRILGGSSGINEMWYTRGSSEDFDRFASVTGDKGWGWDAMFPYFLKNERWTTPADKHNTSGQFNPKFHSTTGMNFVSLPGYGWPTFPRIIAAAAELPDVFPFVEDYNSGSPIGLGWVQSTIGNGTRSSSAASYLGEPFISRPNLDVLVNAQVSRILPSSKDSTHFNQVEFSQDFTTLFVATATKEIILSAGAIASPQILLNSGIGNKTYLESLNIPSLIDLPAVGQNMSEQPLVSNSWFVNTTETYESFNNNDTQRDIDLAQWNATRTGPLVSIVGSHVAFLRLDANGTALGNFEDPAAGPKTPHLEMEFAVIPIPAGGGNFMSVQCVVVSSASRGSVTLNATDFSPFSHPIIDPATFASEFDFQAMKEGLNKVFQFMSTSAWDGFVMRPLDNLASALSGGDAGLEAYIRANAVANLHPVGTTAMSPKGAQWGVVDPDLLLKKATGVRIIDAGVMPYVTSGHTMAPTYAVAERGADLVKQTWA